MGLPYSTPYRKSTPNGSKFEELWERTYVLHSQVCHHKNMIGLERVWIFPNLTFLALVGAYIAGLRRERFVFASSAIAFTYWQNQWPYILNKQEGLANRLSFDAHDLLEEFRVNSAKQDLDFEGPLLALEDRQTALQMCTSHFQQTQYAQDFPKFKEVQLYCNEL